MVRPPQTCYMPRWNGEKWIEEGQAPESFPILPSSEERLMAVEDLLLTLIM